VNRPYAGEIDERTRFFAEVEIVRADEGPGLVGRNIVVYQDEGNGITSELLKFPESNGVIEIRTDDDAVHARVGGHAKLRALRIYRVQGKRGIVFPRGFLRALDDRREKGSLVRGQIQRKMVFEAFRPAVERNLPQKVAHQRNRHGKRE